MDDQSGIRYVFIGQWFQEEAATTRNFIISFFPANNTIEIFDQKTKKLFLKRTHVSNITEKDLYIGSKADVFGRLIEIIDYGNCFTRNKLAPTREKTFLLLRSDAVDYTGCIIKCLNQNGFDISNARMVYFDSAAVREFFSFSSADESKILLVLRSLENFPSIGLELISDNAIKKLHSCIDFSTREEINENYRNLSELRELFQEDKIKNYVHCNKNPKVVQKQLNYFFDRTSSLKTSIQFKDSILAIIKPHAVREGKIGSIITDIYENDFKITGLKMVLLERTNSQEFYEVYRGVLPEYLEMVVQLSSGICMAMEITFKDDSKKADIYKEFRTFCGPLDPEVAKILRPNTLRAKYGLNKVRNAIHCTDLPTDITLELEYFFKILDY